MCSDLRAVEGIRAVFARQCHNEPALQFQQIDTAAAGACNCSRYGIRKDHGDQADLALDTEGLQRSKAILRGMDEIF
jgi:hypothetical protein